ncbi:allantoicase [Actinocatenispora rupis]|uniref:Probable allantoicase n=1 Tax=Actinocatenispora rupis TaxID=519421 RepID=A0A8J3IW39_9ACTN|nr:allantoicase [Actinocatenispora rupis]GID11036.1 putative allantoicase [Actinocatenispora rupis]
MTDLASAALRGTVIAANDDFFAAKENLIEPAAPTHAAHTFDGHGQVYDGWETRRRRTPGEDWAVVRLGAPGVVRTVVVDTAYFVGNYPPRCAVDATAADGYPTVDELTDWVPLVAETPLGGDAVHEFPVTDPHRYTHVRLRIRPDGGVARLRVHGDPVPDPRDLAGPVDLVAAALGGRAVAASDGFFAPPDNLLLPDPGRTMGDGWETARRRTPGNEWVELALGVPGVPRVAEVDARRFLGNAPGGIRLTATDPAGVTLLAETRLQPDTYHRFRLAGDRAVRRVRLDILPDGGLGRLRLYGTPTADARTAATLRWWNALPAAHADAVLAHHPADVRQRLRATRPHSVVPPEVAALR